MISSVPARTLLDFADSVSRDAESQRTCGQTPRLSKACRFPLRDGETPELERGDVLETVFQLFVVADIYSFDCVASRRNV